jgi:hypothetical protein
MRLNSAIFSLVIAVVTISIGSTAAIAQDKPSKWIDDDLYRLLAAIFFSASR